jgi:hypothetical protein
MKLHKSIAISIVTIVLSSCSFAANVAEQSSIPTPDIGTDVQVGKFLEVTAPNGWNSFKTDEAVSLEIRNISENPITSGPDFGMRIFVRSDQGWIEVKNKAGYEYELITLEPTENYDPFKTVGTFVLPELPDYSVASDIRIFVFGDLIENGKEPKKVASYIDLKLNP